MEYLVEKIGMSRTISAPSSAVTLLRVLESKVCEVENGRGFVAYAQGKAHNKAIEGMQKKYGLSREFNKFATLSVANDKSGDLDMAPLEAAKRLKVSFKTKGRGFSGVMKRWNFSGGPKSHGSRFHRRVGSIGNCEWPGRVMKGRKMPGQYGNEKVTVQSEILSFDKANNILVLKGSVSGFAGAFGKIKIVG